jgi:hypothetical protein
VIVLEVGFVAEAHDTQGGGDGALTGSKDGTDDQDLGMLPGPFPEDGSERVQDL